MTDSRDVDDDPYAILGVSRNCTASEAKRKYRLLARRYHPDVNPGPEAAEQMSHINHAYDRVLRRLERRARMQAFRLASTATVASAPGRQRPSSRGIRGISRSVPRGVVWLSILASAGLVALLIVFVARALQPEPPSQATRGGQTSQAPDATILQLGNTTAFQWADSGAVTISERVLAHFPADMHLNEPPQWSHDATYVAMSISPRHSAADMTMTGSTIFVLRGAQILARVSGTSGRWSPLTDQLAVLTDPTGSQTPWLELVSPTMTAPPLVLDTHGGTHLAWSDDGARIAYSTDGQQQLRLATVAQQSHQVLVKARGQQLTPVGWQGEQIIEIARGGGAVELVGIDPIRGRVTTLAAGDTSTTDSTVAVSRDGVTYLTQTPNVPFVTLHWSAPGQHWQAQLLGIQTARLLAAWSGDRTWVAIAPAQSGNNASVSALCLAHTPHAGTPPLQWPVHCLRLPGALAGMSWKPHSNTLSYIRAAQPGGALELRELRIQSARAHTLSAARTPLLVAAGPPMLMAVLLSSHFCRLTYPASIASGHHYFPLAEFEGDP
jgi:DnaJ-like protein